MTAQRTSRPPAGLCFCPAAHGGLCFTGSWGRLVPRSPVTEGTVCPSCRSRQEGRLTPDSQPRRQPPSFPAAQGKLPSSCPHGVYGDRGAASCAPRGAGREGKGARGGCRARGWHTGSRGEPGPAGAPATGRGFGDADGTSVKGNALQHEDVGARVRVRVRPTLPGLPRAQR